MPQESNPQENHYLALYRKYRPRTFEDVRGRDAIVRTLRNQINTGRIGHSYLFCGTRGTGKTTIAKIFARAVNCEQPVDGSPCGQCASCQSIERDASLNVVEMDAASNNGVDDIRTIIDEVSYSPAQGKYRIYIIDEAHMLSTAASNALLKTLEEPPSYAIFILATTDPNKLPLTILSRCQRYDFGRLSPGVIAGRLKEVADSEQLEIEERALRYLAAAADGSLRDGLSLLDQCNAFNYGNGILTYEKTLEILGAVDAAVFSGLFRAIEAHDTVKALAVLEDILSQGREMTQFVTDFVSYLRNIMLLKASEDLKDSLDLSADQLEMMLQDARSAELPEIMRDLRIMAELVDQIRYASNRRILTEMALIRLCVPAMDVDQDSQMVRIHTIEKNMVEFVSRIEGMIRSGAVSGSGADGSPYGGATGAWPYGGAGAMGSVGAGAAGAEQDQMGGYAAAGSRSAGTNPAGTNPAGNPSVQGQTVNAANAANPANVSSAGQGQAASGAAASKVPPKAIPEELRKIAGQWDRLMSEMSLEKPANGNDNFNFFALALKRAKLQVGDQGQLVLVYQGQAGGICGGVIDNPHHRQWLEEFLAAKTGRTVSVSFKLLDNRQEFQDNEMDLRDIIKMDVAQEEIEERNTFFVN